jgi:hypothetical protein
MKIANCKRQNLNYKIHPFFILHFTSENSSLWVIIDRSRAKGKEDWHPRAGNLFLFDSSRESSYIEAQGGSFEQAERKKKEPFARPGHQRAPG